MATANTNDMRLIAQDTSFRDRVKAALVEYVCFGGAPNQAFNRNLMQNLEAYVANFVWAAAVNSTIANEVITTGNANASFPTTTAVGAAVVTTSVQAGLVDSDLSNAVAAAYVVVSVT